MRKIIYILIVLTVSACSSTRKLARKGAESGNRGMVTVADVYRRNITSGNFNIPKCEVEINTDELNEKFIAGIKYEYPGKYLITLRTGLGIELARIFVTSDTILANDRINRVLYFGKPSVLAYKYGIPFDIIPVIFGDLVFSMDNPGIMIECSGERSELADVIAGRRISYDIDCGRKKVSGSVVEGSGGRDNAIVRYSDFRNMDEMTVPSKIEISNDGTANKITLKVDRIERWEGSIEFIPGNRYNRIELR